ncbi:MAG: hypothetical protein K2W96_18475 [Gemmataceae bacterium]|nr:hypothetical protein [Gemmataceae bacterium]
MPTIVLAPALARWLSPDGAGRGGSSILVQGRTVRLAVSCGGVWASEDGGATWRLDGEGMFADYMPPGMKGLPGIQDAHRMQCCAASPEHVWVQHHNGVFRSEDGGRTFAHVANAALSGFGFAVGVHPRDPRTAWLVPAVKDERRVPVDGALAVTRTRDGGATWEVLRKGLPQQHAYDLVYRHALAVDGTGDRLAIGSATGGLWLSDDGGDSWRAAEGRLPPVHAACFV